MRDRYPCLRVPPSPNSGFLKTFSPATIVSTHVIDNCDNNSSAMLCVCAQLGAESTDDVDPVMGLAVLETREDEGEFQEQVEIDTFDHRNSWTTASEQDKKFRHGSDCLFTCYASLNHHIVLLWEIGCSKMGHVDAQSLRIAVSSRSLFGFPCFRGTSILFYPTPLCLLLPSALTYTPPLFYSILCPLPHPLSPVKTNKHLQPTIGIPEVELAGLGHGRRELAYPSQQHLSRLHLTALRWL